jgi:hypothetical protein
VSIGSRWAVEDVTLAAPGVDEEQRAFALCDNASGPIGGAI